MSVTAQELRGWIRSTGTLQNDVTLYGTVPRKGAYRFVEVFFTLDLAKPIWLPTSSLKGVPMYIDWCDKILKVLIRFFIILDRFGLVIMYNLFSRTIITS
jgi:hypothetical protein